MAKKITKIGGNHKNAETQAVAKEIYKAILTSILKEKPQVLLLAGKLNEKTQLLTEVLNTKEEVKVLMHRDEHRDDEFRSLFYLIKGLCHHPDATIAACAQRIFDIISHYGLDIIHESYAVESALIDSFIKGLEPETIKADILQLTGVEQRIELLKTAQNDFVQEKLKQDKEKTDEDRPKSASLYANEIRTLINSKITVFLDGMNVIEPENYSDLCLLIDQIIQDHNSKKQIEIS